ncbi:MAG: nitrite/sulfite reductase [Deltaproteobacteria bacterium]|nr:MAG: nitrite/sulfite reductase [Deltaproteobacteria bacterium]
MSNWEIRLGAEVLPERAADIRAFQQAMAARRNGRLDERLFAELRLRQGVYGQRYDNGHRHDGHASRRIDFPCGDVTKGPETLWDAPGMQRIKIPYGGLDARQLEVIAELAEEYADGILHVTTRQDIQLHFVHIEDTPDIMWRLAAVGITTKEACGNAVRNVTACPLAGVCNDESFDVTPYAEAVARFLLGHPDTQDFGRKFKIAFSGCEDHPCGLARIHDIGAVAKVRRVKAGDGVVRTERGFALYVGGGLGAVPHRAELLDAFVPVEELLPTCQAVCRVFAALGEKKNRARARLKFLLKRLGIEEFRRLVAAERERLPFDPRWRTEVEDVDPRDGPSRPAGPVLRVRPTGDPDFVAFVDRNVRPQAQPGYSVVTVALPLGDLSADQARALADLARTYADGHLRATVEQNFVLRWISNADLRAVYDDLVAAGLAEPVAASIVDITSCPGTDTCKLGISSSRGLSATLRSILVEEGMLADEAVAALRIKVSGCFNSCGQHHVADLGFLGVSRNVDGRRVPHFQVVLGGQWSANANATGIAIGAVPARRVPDVVRRLVRAYATERAPGETFRAWVERLGRKTLRERLSDLTAVPPFGTDPEFYRDHLDPRIYGIGDMAQGECAGEMVSVAKFGLADADRLLDEALDALDEGRSADAARLSFESLLAGARALVRAQTFDVPDEPRALLCTFEARFVATRLFWDEHAKDKFARYLLRWRDRKPGPDDAEDVIREARLFIDHAYRVEANMGAMAAHLSSEARA